MTRTNPEKLSVEYPVITRLKNKMKRNKDITESQVKDFDRRVRRSPVLFEMVKYMQGLDNNSEEGSEIKRLIERGKMWESTANSRSETIEEQKKELEEKDKLIEKLKKFIEDKKWDERLEDSDEEVG
jgi:hypothetical protein